MIILAIICTLVAGVIGAFLEPVSFSVSLPIAVMGGFILYEIKRKIDRSGVLSCVGVNIGMTYDQFKGYTSIAW